MRQRLGLNLPGAPTGGGGRLRELDGWRTISVALVIAYHLQGYSAIARPLLVPLGDYGVTGVQVFFAISGFVIVRGFLGEAQATGRISLLAFYVRRALRILPPLAIYVATIYGLAVMGALPPASFDIVRALTFTCNVPGAQCGGYLGQHTWSLSFEEQFYLVIPVLFATLGLGRRWGLAAVILALPLLSLGLHAAGVKAPANFLGGFIVIGCGVLAALYEAPLRRLIAATPWWLIGAAAVSIYLLRIAPPGKAATIANLLGLGPLIVLVLLGTSFKDGPVRRLLAARPMVALGQASYGVYLWQQLATYAFPGAGVGFYLISIPACIAGSLLLYHTLERRLIAVGHVFSKRQRAGAAAP